MVREQKGFGVVAVVVIVVVVLLVGLIGWRLYTASQNPTTSNTDVAEPQKQETASEQETTKRILPEGWVEYANSDFGFSFAYPSAWGDVQVGDVDYGSEQQAGPRRMVVFTSCDGCEPGKLIPMGSSNPEIAINSRDFGGIGTSRPLALESGYKKNDDGSYTVYRHANTETVYSAGNTLEISLINDVLFVRQNDNFHNFDTTRAIANIANGGKYSAVAFIIHDAVGATVNAELLRSIIETYRAD